MASPMAMTISRVEQAVLPAALAGVVACSAAPRADEPMGVLPSATTTAEAQWVPYVPLAGQAIDADPRETHLREPRRLTGAGRYRSPAFAPDGRSVVVVREGPRGCGALVEVDLVGATRDLDTAGCASHPAYLGPERLVFLRGDGCDRPPSSCSLVELGPAGPRELAPRSSWPAPAGDDLLFVRTGAASRELWRIGGEGAGPAKPVGAADQFLGGLAVAPGRAALAWHGHPAGGDASAEAQLLYVAGLEGQAPRAVPTRGTRASSPAFLTRHQLLFASDLDAPVGRPEALELYLVDSAGPARTDGTAPAERVTFHRGYDGEPTVSPDGGWVAFVSDRAGSDRGVILARWEP